MIIFYLNNVLEIIDSNVFLIIYLEIILMSNQILYLEISVVKSNHLRFIALIEV